MTKYIHMSHADIQAKLPYALICETHEGPRWNTGRCKKLYNERFNKEEQAKAKKIFTNARRWHLVCGVPNHTQMTQDEYDLWQKLGQFCTEI